MQNRENWLLTHRDEIARIDGSKWRAWKALTAEALERHNKANAAATYSSHGVQALSISFAEQEAMFSMFGSVVEFGVVSLPVSPPVAATVREVKKTIVKRKAFLQDREFLGRSLKTVQMVLKAMRVVKKMQLPSAPTLAPTTVSAEALLVTAPCTRCLECLEWTWWHSTPEAKCVCDR